MKRSTKENICVTIIVFIVLSIIAYTFINNKLNNKISNKESIDSTVNLIEVDSEFVDEDDYNQANWKSYTPVSNSIE